jgi:hypothetical protein
MRKQFSLSVGKSVKKKVENSCASDSGSDTMMSSVSSSQISRLSVVPKAKKYLTAHLYL